MRNNYIIERRIALAEARQTDLENHNNSTSKPKTTKKKKKRPLLPSRVRLPRRFFVRGSVPRPRCRPSTQPAAWLGSFLRLCGGLGAALAERQPSPKTGARQFGITPPPIAPTSPLIAFQRTSNRSPWLGTSLLSSSWTLHRQRPCFPGPALRLPGGPRSSSLSLLPTSYPHSLSIPSID